MEKAEAREAVRRAVARLTPSERAEKSRRICERLLALPELERAATVMLYLPLPDELDTRPFAEAILRRELRVYTPRTDTRARRMSAVRLTGLEGLTEDSYGIPTPNAEETCSPADLDFVLTPGRAFDGQGHRLGRGAGYYDRFMTAPGFRAFRCGAAFECQVLDHVPHAAHDVPVEALVTESRTLRIRVR